MFCFARRFSSCCSKTINELSNEYVVCQREAGRERRRKKCLVITKSLNKTNKKQFRRFSHLCTYVVVWHMCHFVSTYFFVYVVVVLPLSFFRSCDTGDDTFLSLQSMPLYRSYILPRSFSTKKKIAEKCGGKLLFYSQASNFLNFVHALLPFFISSKSFFFALVFVFAPSSCLILSLSMRLCCVSFENCSMANEKCTRRKGKKEGVNATHNSSSEEK